jgi:nuclear transport factor 2 (NTF2) superfamily protein
MNRPPRPPFTAETAGQKARQAEDAWNTGDPARVEGQLENDRPLECHPAGAGARRSLAAIFTSSAREPAFIFRITLPR